MQRTPIRRATARHHPCDASQDRDQFTGTILVIANPVRGQISVLAILTIAFITGCSSAPAAPSPAWRAWSEHEGGIGSGSDQQRAAHIFELIAATDGSASIHVLSSDAAGAWAWHDGNIFVTRGLLHLLNDQELAAAIAHEMGHLAADSTMNGASAIDGSTSGLAKEIRADTEGCRLLRLRGLSGRFMADALCKLRDVPGTPSGIRDALTARIDALALEACSD